MQHNQIQSGRSAATGRKALATVLVTLGLGLIGTASAASLSNSSGGAVNPGSAATVLPTLPGPAIITQNSDTTTLNPSTGASCPYAENDHIRRFLLNADHGIAGAFTVNTVRIGVQEAGTSGSQPIELRLYSIPSSAPLVFANLTSIGSAAATVNDGTLFFMDIPVSGTVLDPTTEDLVVDIHVPGGAPYFFPGANSAGQTGPTYLAAAACMLPEITDVATQGFPNDNIVMLVSGEELSITPEECGPGFEDANIIVGTEGDDLLTGTSGKDVIFGLGGDDKISGGNGDDCLIGGYGNDYLLGGAGNDVLIADEPQATMVTNPAIESRDRLNGSRGTDTCYGSTDYYYGKRNGPSYMGPSYRTTYDNCETVIEQTMYPYPD